MSILRRNKETPDNSNHMRFRGKYFNKSFETYKNYYDGVVIGSQEILKGKLPKNLRVFKVSNSVLEKFQESLKKYQDTWQQLHTQERLSKRAKKVLYAYYAQDQIFDFMDMLIRFLKEPPRSEMDPIVYADKAYFNSLTHIRKMVQHLNETYEEVPSEIEINEKLLLERPIEFLKELWSDNADLSVLIDTVIKAEKLRGKMEKELISQEEFKKLGMETELLILLLSNEKLERYTKYLTEETLQIENRKKRMASEVNESEMLYQDLQEVFGSAENNRLMDDLNPDHDKLQGKTVEEIRQAYQPLLDQIQKLLMKFPKKE